MAKDILIFCSWLDVDSNVGGFFSEQAFIIADVYNPILVVFKPISLSKKNLSISRITKIVEKRTVQDIVVLEVQYAQRDVLGYRANNYFQQLAVKKLHSFLINRNIQTKFIHAHSIFDAGIWAYEYSLLYNIPFITTEHQQLSFRNISAGKSKLAVQALNSSYLNLAVSNDKIRQFAANGLFYDFRNVGNLISKNFFLNKEVAKSENLQFITMGAFSPIKDQKTILNALQILDKKVSRKIDFVWIGHNSWGSNNDSKVNKLLSEYHFTNINIILEPNLERTQIANYLNRSHLFLFSSISEGMPVSVLEALACGLPVYTSNCGGVDEIISNKNGIIYQIKDDQKLAALLLEFIRGHSIYDAELISKDILEKYGEHAFREKLLMYYRDVENSNVI